VHKLGVIAGDLGLTPIITRLGAAATQRIKFADRREASRASGGKCRRLRRRAVGGLENICNKVRVNRGFFAVKGQEDILFPEIGNSS
jgi:hypothetical protein